MDPTGSGARGRGAHPRGHRPHRGGGGGGGRGGRGARGRARGGRGGAMATHQAGASQLAPGAPHPGYFHESFLENPWYDLETKLGLPHLPPVSTNQTPASQQDAVHASSTADTEAEAQTANDNDARPKTP